MEILANLCESVLWIVFLKIFCRPKYSRKIDFPGAVTAVLLLMASIGFSDQFALFSQYTVLMDFVIAFGYTMLFLEGMWYWKLFLIAVYNVALLGSSVLAVNTFVNLFHVDATVLVAEGNPLRIAMIVTAKVVLVILVILSRIFRDKIMVLQRAGVWVIVFPLITISVGTTLFQTLVHFYRQTSDIVWMVWLLLMVCALCFMSFQLAYDAYRGKQQKKMSDFLRKQMIIQQQTYKQQYENIRKVRKTQHDMKHRLVVIEQQLLEKDYERAQNYTRDFLMELDGVKEFKYGDNPLSTLLLMKEEIAKENGIDISIDMDVLETTRISDLDLAMILGNLMDNAIEAAKEVKENPEIRVLIKTKGVLYISVRNTVKDSEMEKPFRHNYTTKEDALLHGFGISCIRELVDKNGGRFDLNVSEGWFRAEIFF